MNRTHQPRHRRSPAATRRPDVVRRGVVIALVAVLLALVPGIAMAKFSSSAKPAGLSVATARLVAPSFGGTYRCTGFLSEAVEATVTGLTAEGQPSGVAYDFILYREDSPRDNDSSPTGKVTLSSAANFLDLNNSYRITVVARLGGWTTDVSTRRFACAGRPSSGTF